MSAPFQIIKNAPPPGPRKGGPGSTPVYPFAQMEVGDAFDAPRDGVRRGGADRAQGRISSAASQWRKSRNPSAKFTVRILDENTVRCWRVA